MKKINLETMLGYAGEKKPMQKEKIRIQLEKAVRYENCIYSYTEWVLLLVSEGATPKMVEYQGYKKDGTPKAKLTKEYRLYTSDKTAFWEVNKTQFDFVLWCIDNDITTLEKALEVDRVEKARQDAEEAEKERIEAEEKARIEKEKAEIEAFENEAYSYIPSAEMVEAYTTVFERHYGEFDARRMRYFLPYYIENIDNPIAKNKLCELLHNGNVASIELFYIFTGLRLPKSHKDRIALIMELNSEKCYLLDSFKAVRKKAEHKEKELHDFYICSNEKGYFDFIKKQGEKLVYKGITLYIDKREKGLYTTEERTGSSLAVNKATKKEAIEYTKNIINTMGCKNLIDKIEKMVIRNTREIGLNPILAGEDIPKYSEEEKKI